MSEMNIQPLSHDDAMALMAGSLPPGRGDLMALAEALDDFRDAFAEAPPSAAPELVVWLTGTPALPRPGTGSGATAAAPVAIRTGPRTRWMRTTTRALAGLGLTAKIALGGTVALAAVTTAGVAGVLPEEPQTVFDRILEDRQADTPPPGTPSGQNSGTDTGARSDTGSGEQSRNVEPSPDPSPLEPQGEGGGDRTQDTTSEPSPSGSEPTAEPEGLEEDGDAPQESQEATEDQSDDGDDHSPAEDTETVDGSGGDAIDTDDSKDSTDDVEDGAAETEDGGSTDTDDY